MTVAYEGRTRILSTKPVIAGAGTNFQRHCHREIFTGVGHKFRDFIQAVHRAQRFQQTEQVRIDIIYTEAQRPIRKSLEARRLLPTTFMLLQPPSWHPDVWTDVARMRTLNMVQAREGRGQHLCPLQFDIVDRLITQHSEPGEIVYDPFAGIMTVPYCAVKLGRTGWGCELSTAYWSDGVHHVESLARDASTPTLFDLEGLSA